MTINANNIYLMFQRLGACSIMMKSIEKSGHEGAFTIELEFKEMVDDKLQNLCTLSWTVEGCENDQKAKLKAMEKMTLYEFYSLLNP